MKKETVVMRTMLDKIFNIEVEGDILKKLPACFIYNNKRWDYSIKSEDRNHAKSFALKLQSTKTFEVKHLEKSDCWIVRFIRH
jgi:hypothetical protein